MLNESRLLALVLFWDGFEDGGSGSFKDTFDHGNWFIFILIPTSLIHRDNDWDSFFLPSFIHFSLHRISLDGMED